ncbi:putative Methyltransferase domain-containing protein [Seiridium cardinale]|uniref:Methyltransferase domain-containing protein n=1 Tax=Seiridium cardinale TaxID=138064 RepID=A0ABR2XFL5_9PEZI
MSSTDSTYDPATYWVAPARNFRTSARLHLQHLLFQNTLGGLILEPGIEKSLPADQPLKVADLACGNGIWLSDLARHLESQGRANFQLDGYDVNPINFPPAHLLPAYLQFKELDVVAPFPEELVGAYDVVHIRALVSIVPNDDPSHILNQALSLLKPGGWLQWEEARADSWTTQAPPGVSKTSTDIIVQLLTAGARARGTTFEFLGKLDQHFSKARYEDVSFRQVEKRPVDMKAWTEDYLMVWEELPSVFPSKEQAPQSPMTKEAFTELFLKAVAETEQGVVVHHKAIVVTSGRKAA